MKKLKWFKYLIILFLFIAATLLLSGCAVYYTNATPALPVDKIVQMSKDGAHSKDIIKEMRKSRSVYLLKADELAQLRNEGVADSVINYMEKTHIDAVARDQAQQYNNYGYGGWGNNYWYGYPMYGMPYGGYWGYSWSPNIIIENRGYRNGGESHEGGGEKDRR